METRCKISHRCIRFIHALPVEHNVDVVITQTASQQTTAGNKTSVVAAPAVSFTWTNYAFAQHSNWVNVFQAGSGTMQLWENLGGQRQPKLLYSKEIPLTPGPLVVALKVALDQDPAEPSKFWCALLQHWPSGSLLCLALLLSTRSLIILS